MPLYKDCHGGISSFMKKFFLVTNCTKDRDNSFTQFLVKYIESRECSVTTYTDNGSVSNDVFRDIISEDTDFIIVLGGDGTIIRNARLSCKLGIPLLGINIGTLGFLSSVEKNEAAQAIDRLIGDDYLIEERMLIEAEFTKADASVSKRLAVNDIVVARKGVSRLIKTEIMVNGDFVNTYSGDGVLVATPTGSTGYNLSAGGPVVTPEARLMVITPICPHSLNDRSIVVSSHDEISMKLDCTGKSPDTEAIVTFDGQETEIIGSNDKLVIRKAAEHVKLVRFKDKGFFKVLYKKLGK